MKQTNTNKKKITLKISVLFYIIACIRFEGGNDSISVESGLNDPHHSLL